jgi:VHL beta domain
LERPTNANIPSVCPAGGPNAGVAPPTPANYDRVVYDVRSSPNGWLSPKILMRYGRVPNGDGTIDPCKNPVSSDPIADALTNSTTSTPSCSGILSGSPGFYVCSENNQYSLYFQSSLVTSTVKTISSAVSSRLQTIQPTVLPAQNCANEGAARSLNNDMPTELSFLNQKTVPVKVYWLDFAGVRQFYSDLAPNQQIKQPTFLTHPWVVTDTGTPQTCLGIYWPTEGSGLAVIK